MILYLGASVDAGDFQPITIPDDYPVADVIALLPTVWWGTSPPVWVASTSSQLAEATSDRFGGIEIRPAPLMGGV